MDRVYSLYQTFPEGRATEADVPRNPYGREQPASPAHLSVCQRLRRVIEELVDTEKSYVKVSAAVRLNNSQSHLCFLPDDSSGRHVLLKRFCCVCQDLVCLFDIYLTPLQKETFLSKDEVKTQTLLNQSDVGLLCRL